MLFGNSLSIEPNREGKCPDGEYSAILFPSLVVIVAPHPMGFRGHNFIAEYRGVFNVEPTGEPCRVVVKDNAVEKVLHGVIWSKGRDTGEVYK